MVDETLLDYLSRTLYRGVLERFPEWHSFAEIAEDDAGDGRSILFKVPQPGSERFLWISTEDGEVTISFDKWHTHESAWLGDQENDVDVTVEGNIVRRSLKLIEDILNEQEVVVVRYRDGAWAGSALQAATDDIEPISGEVTHVFSWRGTFDQVITA